MVLSDEDRQLITNYKNNDKFYQLINDDDTYKVSKVRNKDILDALMNRAIELVNEAYEDYINYTKL